MSQQAHDAAVARGQPGYLDPVSGLYVMTAASLRARGWCCGNGCRHCPYPAAEQHRAGRPGAKGPG
jgi:hypothetical protein